MQMNVENKVIEDFAARVVTENPLHKNFLRASLSHLTAESREGLISYLGYCQARGLDLDYLVSCYNTIVTDMQMEQIHFHKHKAYRHSTFAEVAAEVYFNDDYMKRYMYGLALTSFLWRSHAAIHEFFLRTFPRGARGTYLEIGPGHGYYFMRAAMLGAFERMIGVDISASSVALTRDIVDYCGVANRSRVSIVEGDFLALPQAQADYSCIVMGEVLEHVEAPGTFLAAIARLSGPATHIYVTTCINAPAIDHIYHFRTRQDVRDLIAANDLTIVEEFAAPYADKSLAESEASLLPLNVAYVLRKR